MKCFSLTFCSIVLKGCGGNRDLAVHAVAGEDDESRLKACKCSCLILHHILLEDSFVLIFSEYTFKNIYPLIHSSIHAYTHTQTFPKPEHAPFGANPSIASI